MPVKTLKNIFTITQINLHLFIEFMLFSPLGEKIAIPQCTQQWGCIKIINLVNMEWINFP